MPKKPEQKVNCHAQRLPDGTHHLVFMIGGTEHCVGEIRLTADADYLRTIAQMFSKWAAVIRPDSIVRLPSALHNILNG